MQFLLYRYVSLKVKVIFYSIDLGLSEFRYHALALGPNCFRFMYLLGTLTFLPRRFMAAPRDSPGP